MTAVDLILLFLSIAALAHYVLAVYAGVRFFVGEAAPKSTDRISGSTLPAISILKPIAGADDDTYENLASFCRQAFPQFEIVFGVQNASDPALPIIERLALDFPDANVRYAICERVVGANPKVNNLAAAYEIAMYDILVLSDSDVRVGPDYLANIVQPFFDADTDVVTCLYRTRAEGGIAALEALGLATEACPIDLLSRYLEGMTFAMGPTIAVRRSALQSIGGLKAVADYLHDDYQLGNMLYRAGHKIVLSHYVVDHVVGPETWTDLIQRQVRWTRGTRCARSLGYFGLIFTFGTVWSLLFLLSLGGSTIGWLVFLAVWAVRYFLAWLIGVRYLNDEVARKWLTLVPLRDFMSFGFWLYGFAGDTIVWRGKRMRLLRDGKLAHASP